MADDDAPDIRRILDDAPDMSDLAIVVVNVETVDGLQYSFMLEREEDGKMSMVYDVEEQAGADIMEQGSAEPVRVVPARVSHRFQVAVEVAG